METLSELLNKVDKAQELVFLAMQKRENIAKMPYYDIFGRPGERQNDLNKMTLVILRLQNYFYKKLQQARETRIQ